MTNIRTQTPPNLSGVPVANVFNRANFNSVLWENGYDVQLESAVACPCQTGGTPHPMCSNCMGTGWVFVNPINTRAFLSSINNSTKYKDWSTELVGTIAATFMNTNRFSFMDKITLLKNYGFNSESLRLRTATIGGVVKHFVFTTYNMNVVDSVFLFNTDSAPLIKLTSADYSINVDNPFVLDISSTAIPSGYSNPISISYSHNISYNIVDIPHDMRLTYEIDQNGKRTMQDMPIQCIARKSYYELGRSDNYLNNTIQTNSWK